jgi:hypothetical protein
MGITNMNAPGTTWANPSSMSAPYGGVQPGNMWQQPPPPPSSSTNNPFAASNGSSVRFNRIFDY